MGKRGRRGRQTKHRNLDAVQEPAPSPQHAAEKITRYFAASPDASHRASSTPSQQGKAQAGGDAHPLNGAACAELIPGLLTPESTPTKPPSAPLPEEDPDRTLPYPLEPHSPPGATGSRDQENTKATRDEDGASSLPDAERLDAQHAKRVVDVTPSQDQVRGHSSGASRSLQGQMDSEARTKRSKKGRRKKSSKAGAKTSSTQSAPKPKPKEDSIMKTMKDFFPVRRSDRRCKSIIDAERKVEMEEAILSDREEGIEVREMVGKGRGVVSTKSFRRGEFVVEYHGDLIDLRMAKDREAEYKADPSIGCYMYYFEHKNRQYCIDATRESGRLGRLLNHSRNGNCCTKLIDIGDRPYLILVAKRDLKAGEELLYDYGDRNKETLHSHPWLAL